MSRYKDLAGHALGAGQGIISPAWAVALPGGTRRLEHVWFEGVDRAEGRDVRPRLERTKGVFGEPKDLLPEKAPEQPDSFLIWLFAEAGLDANTYSPRFLQRRLSPCLRFLRVESPADARKLLEDRPKLVKLAVQAVLIGVSGFFRDEEVFERLRTEILPQLLRTRDGLRLCSIGCSEGQELYSMAMLLAEQRVLEHSHLLGVDCRPDAIARARAGCFANSELEGVPSEFQERFFNATGSGSGMRLSTHLRAHAHWQEANCMAWDYSQRTWDLILFRNVAIYLNRGDLVGIWERLVQGLKPGGVLVTGKAEQPPKELPLTRICHCIYAAADGEGVL